MSGSTSAHTAPVTRFTRPSRSPLSVAIVSSASTATSCFLAKPIAGDHSPSLVFAAASAVPKLLARYQQHLATSETITVKRLGVANTLLRRGSGYGFVGRHKSLHIALLPCPRTHLREALLCPAQIKLCLYSRCSLLCQCR